MSDPKKPRKGASDPGVADKRLLVVESEFASVLQIIRREGNILSPLIRDAWDHGNLRQMVKNAPGKATGAHISIIGHITQTELLRSLGQVQGFNGFANRFLWLWVRRSKLLPEGGEKVDMSAFASRLKAAVEHAQTVKEMYRDPDAAKLWREQYKRLIRNIPGLWGGVTSRGEAQVLRLSMVYALLDKSSVIREEHLKAALALWQYAEDSAKFIFGASTGDAVADRFLELIRQGPCTRKELHDKTNRHYSKAEVDRALDLLRRLGLIRREREETGGRPAERWYAV